MQKVIWHKRKAKKIAAEVKATRLQTQKAKGESPAPCYNGMGEIGATEDQLETLS